MGLLTITEFQTWPLSGAPVAEQSVEFGGTAVKSKPFSGMTQSIRVVADQTCALSFNGNADPKKHRMPADVDREYQVSSGGVLSVVSVGRSTDDVTDLSALMAYLQAFVAAAKLTDRDYLEGKLAELRAATEEHEAVKVAAEEAHEHAVKMHVLAKLAQTQAEAQQEAMSRQMIQVASANAGISDQLSALNDREARLTVRERALQSGQAEVETKRSGIDAEIERQLRGMKAEHEARMAAVEDEHKRLEGQVASLEAREQALLAAQKDHAEAVSAMKEFAARLGKVA